MTTSIADELRRRLAGDEASANVDLSHETEAAVLVPLFLVDDELHAVFTKRRDDMRRHPGEISFPGGRRDHAHEPLQTTALREAEEEVGLTPDSVELVGTLAPVRTFVHRLRDLPPRRADPTAAGPTGSSARARSRRCWSCRCARSSRGSTSAR